MLSEQELMHSSHHMNFLEEDSFDDMFGVVDCFDASAELCGHSATSSRMASNSYSNACEAMSSSEDELSSAATSPSFASVTSSPSPVASQYRTAAPPSLRKLSFSEEEEFSVGPSSQQVEVRHQHGRQRQVSMQQQRQQPPATVAPPVHKPAAPRLEKVQIKAAREKETCYSTQFPDCLYKKPHKYDLKMQGSLDHQQLKLFVVYTDEPIENNLSKAMSYELSFIDKEQESIARFCLLSCTRGLGNRTTQLVITTPNGVEIYRSTPFKCLARKRPSHSKKIKNNSNATSQKQNNTTEAAQNSSSRKRKAATSLGSVSSPPSTPIHVIPPPAKRQRINTGAAVPMPIPVMQMTPPPSGRVTWDLFQLLCSLDTSKIEQRGGNSRVALAMSLLNVLTPEERNAVLRTYSV